MGESMMASGVTEHERAREMQWAAIRAARAFYGRPLEPEDLVKVRQASGRGRRRGRAGAVRRSGSGG